MSILQTHLGRIFYHWAHPDETGDAVEDAAPLLVLHGGPGIPHDYLIPMSGLARGRSVLFWDQLGCGRSVRNQDVKWSVNLVLQEVELLLDHLDIERCHVIGHSWGGMLGLEWAAFRSERVVSLVCVSSGYSIPRLIADRRALLRAQPEWVQSALLGGEAQDRMESPSYLEARRVWNAAHVYRGAGAPPARLVPRHLVGDEVISEALGSDRLFSYDGELKDWDIRERLDRVQCPVLYVAGEFDATTPHNVQVAADLTPRGSIVVSAGSAHYPHAENAAEFFQLVDDFMTSAT